MHRLEYNFETGETREVELTAEEIEELQSQSESNSIPEPEPLTPEQKLQNAGLTIEELKSLLGL